MNNIKMQRTIRAIRWPGRFLNACLFSSLVLATIPAQAVRFRLPLSSDTGVHYYYDHNTSSGVTAWNCSGTSYNGHGGSDFSGGPRGRAIFASASGTLSYKIDGFGDGFAGSTAGGGAGNHVRIDHGGGVVTWYAHMTAGSVTGRPVGSAIACSEQVGGVGTSGSSTGLHLHFTVQVNGANRDPFNGGCGGLGWWVNQGSGSPSTTCENSGPPVRGTPPQVLVEPDGRLIAFAVITGGSIQYREQTGPSQPFGGWASLGGSAFTNVRAVRANNKFYVFGTGNGGPVWWNYQSQPAGAFSGWVNLLGTFTKVKPVALPDGRLAMFATSASSAVSYQVQTAVGETWPTWSSLGGSGFDEIDGYCLSDGRLGVVGTGNSNAYVNYQTSPGGAWTGWINVGGTGITSVRAVVLSDNRVALFGNNGGYGNPGACFVQVQGSVNGAFPGWSSLGGSGLTEIAACRYADNRLAFFATGPASTPYYQYQTSPGGAWSGWGTPGGSSFGGIDATVFATDKLVVFGHGGAGGSLLYNYINTSWSWAGWTDLGGSLIY